MQRNQHGTILMVFYQQQLKVDCRRSLSQRTDWRGIECIVIRLQ